jgi:hypothetical protein
MQQGASRISLIEPFSEQRKSDGVCVAFEFDAPGPSVEQLLSRPAEYLSISD